VDSPSSEPTSASLMNAGVGCFGSPMERSIGASAAFGVAPASSALKRSKG